MASETLRGRIFIDFGRHFGTLGGARGALVDDLGHFWDLFSHLYRHFFEMFPEITFSHRFEATNLRKKCFFGVRARMWLLYNK